MPSPADYRIRVSAGTGYDAAGHVPVRVNDPAPLRLRGPAADVWLNVRIRDHRHYGGGGDGGGGGGGGGGGDDNHDREDLDAAGRPLPATSPYFDSPPHRQNDDTYAISLWFVPRGQQGEEEGIAGADLQWGNDFDQPIRDRLPPGFGTALRIVKWWIDPGLEGDPYADKPYLYGPALSSFNGVYVRGGADSGSKPPADDPPADHRGLWFGEGGDAAGRAWRAALGCPTPAGGDPGDGSDTGDGSGTGGGSGTGDGDGDGGRRARMKWALGAEAKARWTWHYGRGYGLDFYNGYLDFQDLALRLPGFHMPLLRYWDGAQSLRYVLRHRQTGAVYLVVVFELIKVGGGGDDNDNDKDKDDRDDDQDEPVDESKVLEEARRKLAATDSLDISADDVD